MLEKDKESGAQWHITIRSAVSSMSLLCRPPKHSLGATTKLAPLPEALKKVNGEKHINFGKVDPRTSESDGRGFLLAEVDMVFAMFFLRRIQAEKISMGDSPGGTLLVYVSLVETF